MVIITSCYCIINETKMNLDNFYYLTLCTFSFEINESRCLIQDVVSPHCGDNRMARRCMRRKRDVMHRMQSPSEYCTHFNSTLAICLKFVFIEILDKLITYLQCVGTRLYIRSCLLRELTASLVPPHYVCNGYLSGFFQLTI